MIWLYHFCISKHSEKVAPCWRQIRHYELSICAHHECSMSAAWGQKTTKHTQQSMKYLLRLKVMEKSIYAQIVILFIFLAKFIHLYRNCAKCRHIHFMSHYTDLILETDSPEINAFSWGKKTLGNPIRETICVYNSLKWFFIVETLLLFCEWENYLTPSVFNNLVWITPPQNKLWYLL